MMIISKLHSMFLFNIIICFNTHMMAFQKQHLHCGRNYLLSRFSTHVRKARTCDNNRAVQQQSSSPINYVDATTVAQNVFWLSALPAQFLDCSREAEEMFRCEYSSGLESFHAMTTSLPSTLLLPSCHVSTSRRSTNTHRAHNYEHTGFYTCFLFSSSRTIKTYKIFVRNKYPAKKTQLFVLYSDSYSASAPPPIFTKNTGKSNHHTQKI